MKITGICGSPRKKGNTSLLLKKALKGAAENGAETEIVYLADYEFRGCIGCEGCRDSFKCIIDDGMQDLYEKVLDSDGLILASPTYFYNVSSLMKAFIDRLYCLYTFDREDRSCWTTAIASKPGIRAGAVLAVCEQESLEMMGCTAEAMGRPLNDLGFRVVGTVRAFHAFNPGEISGTEEILEEAEKTGARVAGTIRLGSQN